MAQITKYVAQQQLNPDSVPNAPISDVLGNAIQGFGNAAGNLAEVFEKKKQQKEDFTTENNYRKMQLDLGQNLVNEAQNIAPDGADFHDNYMKNVYQPTRDKFLASVPDRLREKYATILGEDGVDTANWSIKAATTERDQTQVWYKQQIGEGQQELANAISLDPKGYDSYLKQGYDAIDSSGLDTATKMRERAGWEHMAQVAHLNRMLEVDPEGVLKDLGADPRYLSPTTQFDSLKKALVLQETGGEANPNSAVSKAGAIGIMQVMPGTARDIAKEIRDTNFNPEWDPTQVAAYLSNPVVNQRYGDYYLKKQIRDFAGRGGLEAALIAYNGGPARAEAWIKSGFDDSSIPKESANYYKEIMGRLPGMTSTQKGDPSAVKLVFSGRTDISGQDESHINKDLTDRVKSSFAALGLDRVRITSGYRSEQDNERVGGAKGSQHMHGNAMDIDVSGYSIPERVRIIQTLSANGITGLGIGANIIHADLGGRRAWGYASSAGGGAVPKWAQAAINAHLANSSTAPTAGVGLRGRYATLPYNDRQKFIAQADQGITQRYNAQSKTTAVQRVQLQNAMNNEAASIQKTGQSTGQLDDTQVSTILGEDDYIKWMDRKQLAQRTFNATDGIAGMTTQEMGDRIADYAPTPGSPTFAADTQVQAAVQKEVDRVTRMRANRPDEAALEFPDVKEAQAKVQAGMAQGAPDPADVQAFVASMLNRQKEFNLKPGSEAPVPRDWAMEIGRSLSRVPEISGRNLPDVNAALTAQYLSLQKVFGPYTEEVILYALAQYKGIGKNTGDLITSYMQAIEAGGDPLKLKPSPAQDRDQTESVGWWQTAKNFFYGDDDPTAPADPGAPEPATILRPFGPDERRDNADGSYSTEISTTWKLPDGSWVNVPSLWMGPNGPKQFEPGDEDGIMSAMKAYEASSGKQFPRFKSEQAAVAAAEKRSAAGGTGSGELASRPVDNETIIRVIGALNGATPEDEAAIVERYGKAAVDAAKLRIQGGQQ